LFLRGMVPLIGFKSAIVYYTRSERFAGESKYPLRKMLALALDAVTSFSVAPLRFITGIGFLVLLLSVGMGVWTLSVRLFTHRAGMWPALASAIGFVASSSGNYLLNYHFTFQSGRPHGPAAAKFVTLAAVGLVINFVLMQILGAAGVYYLLAQVCATAVVFLW